MALVDSVCVWVYPFPIETPVLLISDAWYVSRPRPARLGAAAGGGKAIRPGNYSG
jgi:hypothetical protein